MWIKFKKHKLAMAGTIILAVIYLISGIFCEFFSPYNITEVHNEYGLLPPQSIHFFDSQGRFHLRPFVYGLTKTQDPVTWENVFKEDPNVVNPIYLFVRGEQYKLWGVFPSNLHLFGVKEGAMFLTGTDLLGRDMLSRMLYAGRISLSIGFVGVGISFILGNLLGGISGYYGGVADLIIQRVIEFLSSVPTIPLWMSLAAALPAQWPSLKVYFGITIILSLLGWTGLARVVRGKLLELREEDFVMAAQLVGANDFDIIRKHLLPSFASYLIVSMTLSVPGMILSETALSFLGLGLRPPVVSWGVLLQQAQNFQTVANNPWLLIPGIGVVVVVLCFNFLGDGLRDAADPYVR
jgi:peptide/nickel transport system permease protein